MTDKELLELAAKAAGELTPNWYGNEAYLDGLFSKWNPLTDDGDALRLAVKSGLGIRFYLNGVGAGEEYEMNHDDPYAATRRTIVRAAAAIGRGME
jgi:hypothetical protein